MLGRYQIRRGASLAALPERVRHGIRQDTRKHTRHCLRPEAAMVTALLQSSLADRATAFTAFARAYRDLLTRRVAVDPRPFDALAALARDHDVFLGCSCPTARNPETTHCHTVLALRFLADRYPGLSVELPD